MRKVILVTAVVVAGAVCVLALVPGLENQAIDHGHTWLDANQWLAIWLTGVGTAILAVGVVVALIGLWDARKTRDGELVTQLGARWSDEAMTESRMAYSGHGPSGTIALLERVFDPPAGQAVTQTDLETFYLLTRWPTFIETIGVLHDHGAISTDIVYEMWGAGITAAWKVWEEPVERLKDIEKGYPETYSHFKSLSERMEREVKKRARKWWRLWGD